MSLICIGDIHGKTEKYIELVSNFNKSVYSVQLGDFGFRRSYNMLKHSNIDHTKHKFFPGNHDDYDSLDVVNDYCLGDFGIRKLGGQKFFFVRGAYSIDKHHRVEGRDWWRNEELNYSQATVCFDEYAKNKPNIVLSHDCPASAIMFVMTHHSGDKSLTNNLLQTMFDAHRPSLWIFGHHHVNIDFTFKDCRFICLPELGTFQIN